MSSVCYGGDLSPVFDSSLPTPRPFPSRNESHEMDSLTARFNALNAGPRKPSPTNSQMHSRKGTQTTNRARHISTSTFPESKMDPLSSPLSEMSILQHVRSATPPQTDNPDGPQYGPEPSERSGTFGSPGRRHRSKASHRTRTERTDVTEDYEQRGQTRVRLDSHAVQAGGTITPTGHEILAKKRSHASGLSGESERKNALAAMDSKLQLQQAVIRAIENVMKLGKVNHVYQVQCSTLVHVMTLLFQQIRANYDVDQNNDLHRNMIRMSRRLRAWTSTVRRSANALDWPLVGVTLEAYKAKYQDFIDTLPLADDYNLTVTLNSRIEAHNESRRKDAELRAMQKAEADRRRDERAEIRQLRDEIKLLRSAVGDGLKPPSLVSQSEAGYEQSLPESSGRVSSRKLRPRGHESNHRGSLDIFEPTPAQTTMTVTISSESDASTSEDEMPEDEPLSQAPPESLSPPPVPPKSPEMMIGGQAHSYRPMIIVPPLAIPVTVSASPKRSSRSPHKAQGGSHKHQSSHGGNTHARTIATSDVTRSPSRQVARSSNDMDLSTLPRSVATSPVTPKAETITMTPKAPMAAFTESSVRETSKSRASGKSASVKEQGRGHGRERTSASQTSRAKSKTASSTPAAGQAPVLHFMTTPFAPQAKRPAHGILNEPVNSPPKEKYEYQSVGSGPNVVLPAYIIPADFTMGHHHSFSMPTTLVEGAPTQVVQLTGSFSRFNFPARDAEDAGGSLRYSPPLMHMPSPNPYAHSARAGSSRLAPIPSLSNDHDHTHNGDDEDLITFDDERTVMSRTKTQSMPRTPSTIRPTQQVNIRKSGHGEAGGSRSGWTADTLRTVTPPMPQKRFTQGPPPEYGALGSPFSQSKFMWDTKDEYGDFGTQMTSENGI